MRCLILAIVATAALSGFATARARNAVPDVGNTPASISMAGRQMATAVKIAMGPTSAAHKPGGTGNVSDDTSSKCGKPSGKCGNTKQQ